MQLDNYLRREYPGYILQNVTGDGSCQMGALGVGLTNNQDDKYILGRASNFEFLYSIPEIWLPFFFPAFLSCLIQ